MLSDDLLVTVIVREMAARVTGDATGLISFGEYDIRFRTLYHWSKVDEIILKAMADLPKCKN